ncbi:hypothetical protein [Roseateles toxinivorans]|uniref:Uncharacterized protein n=1 Tax=Roseateles toxinivorans TaxID=270368 RepID=A0A4R6QTU5_9BURK|nr:hypothetical protein [Roseateles toxinivorans]TDP74152.1 hypothetical protein DES47_101204 [Roseateles toxinivorans]
MTRLIKPLLLALGIGLTSASFAADKWVSVPSTPSSDQRLVINGGNLGASAPVTLRIKHPGGGVTVHQTVADAQGKLKFEYTLSITGGYGVEVFDAAGQLIGSGRLGFMR